MIKIVGASRRIKLSSTLIGRLSIILTVLGIRIKRLIKLELIWDLTLSIRPLTILEARIQTDPTSEGSSITDFFDCWFFKQRFFRNESFKKKAQKYDYYFETSRFYHLTSVIFLLEMSNLEPYFVMKKASLSLSYFPRFLSALHFSIIFFFLRSN